MTPDSQNNLRNFLTSNQSGAALVKEQEEWLAAEKVPLVDLRSIPPALWPEYFGRNVSLPADIQTYLDGRETGPMTEDEVHALELAIERHHGVTQPFYIAATPTIQAAGRAWSYVPEAAPYVSGFEFNSSKE